LEAEQLVECLVEVAGRARREPVRARERYGRSGRFDRGVRDGQARQAEQVAPRTPLVELFEELARGAVLAAKSQRRWPTMTDRVAPQLVRRAGISQDTKPRDSSLTGDARRPELDHDAGPDGAARPVIGDRDVERHRRPGVEADSTEASPR